LGRDALLALDLLDCFEDLSVHVTLLLGGRDHAGPEDRPGRDLDLALRPGEAHRAVGGLEKGTGARALGPRLVAGDPQADPLTDCPPVVVERAKRAVRPGRGDLDRVAVAQARALEGAGGP